MTSLSETERGCLDRYCALLAERLDDRLVEVRVADDGGRLEAKRPGVA